MWDVLFVFVRCVEGWGLDNLTTFTTLQDQLIKIGMSSGCLAPATSNPNLQRQLRLHTWHCPCGVAWDVLGKSCCKHQPLKIEKTLCFTASSHSTYFYGTRASKKLAELPQPASADEICKISKEYMIFQYESRRHWPSDFHQIMHMESTERNFVCSYLCQWAPAACPGFLRFPFGPVGA